MVKLVDVFTIFTQVFTGYNVLVSLPLYILTIRTLFKRRRVSPFDSPYFIMFFVLGIADIIAYIMYIFRKLTYWGFVVPVFLPFGVNNFYVRLANYTVWVTRKNLLFLA